MKTDMHNSIRTARVIAPVAAGTTGTGQVGKIVDRKGYAGVELIFGYGAITATAATFTVTVKEGDATGTMTSVAVADLIGTEALAGIAAGARTSGSTKLVSKRLGYKGSKRYVQANIVNTATAGTPVSCTALLHTPTVGPTANP
jgi:hypothetical protein